MRICSCQPYQPKVVDPEPRLAANVVHLEGPNFMKLTSKLYLLLLFIGNIAFSQSWVTTEVTDFAIIDFPVASELTETGAETVFSASDANAVYGVTIRKLSDQESLQITQDEIPNLYQGFASGAVNAVGGEIVSMNEIIIDEISGLEIEYKTHPDYELPGQRFKRIIYVNQNIISIDFWPLAEDDALMIENRAKFFDSFSINLDEIANIEAPLNSQETVASTAYKIGYVVGLIMSFLLFVGLLVGLFFLIRYLIRRSTKNPTISKPVEQPKIKPEKITCDRCDTENNYDAKYCKGCGYELPKN